MSRFIDNINIQKIFTIILISVLLSVSCEKEKDKYIPTVPDFSIELNVATDLATVGAGSLITITPNKSQPEYSDIKYYSANVQNKTIPYKCYGNGIVLVKGFDGKEYKAYDLTCPVNAFTEYCAVTFKSNSIDQNAVCPCCKSEFILFNSCVPKSGSQAQSPLHQYNVSVISFDSKLLISN